MKIATWNIERLKHRKKLDRIVEVLNEVDADILILTEADEQVELPQYPQKVLSQPLNEPTYDRTEFRTIVYSKFKLIGNRDTYDDKTAICPILETSFGPLAVYGTIIGIHGNRRQSFREDLEKQLSDFESVSKETAICIAGDFNMSFSDNYYFTKNGRQELNGCFNHNSLVNLTAELPEAIDHIVVSKSFVKDRSVKLTEWNLDKSLSDHKGVCVEIL